MASHSSYEFVYTLYLLALFNQCMLSAGVEVKFNIYLICCNQASNLFSLILLADDSALDPQRKNLGREIS